MKSMTSLFKLAALLLSYGLLGCQLNPPDVEICQELIGGSADCDYTISDKPRFVLPPEREVERIGQFCMGPKELAEYQNFVVKACEITKACSDDLNTLRSQIDEFNQKFRSGNSRLRDQGNDVHSHGREN